MDRLDSRPMPTLDKEEIHREISKLTDEQIDELDKTFIEYFSNRSINADRYQKAIRKGWLLGPA